jgi:hypothetical protein
MSKAKPSKPRAAKPPAEKKRMGRPPAADGGRTAQYMIRMRPTYKDWLLSYADFRRSDASVVIDQAVAAMAKVDGFEEPPPR